MDSDIIMHNRPYQHKLKIYEIGSRAVVGFGGQEIMEIIDIAILRDQIADLIKESGCKEIVFDLSGVKYVPSGLLGVIVSVKSSSVKATVRNPSDDVREVLEITHLFDLVSIE